MEFEDMERRKEREEDFGNMAKEDGNLEKASWAVALRWHKKQAAATKSWKRIKNSRNRRAQIF